MKPTLGILMLDTTFPRIVGDIGNSGSYDFPIQLRVVKGATVKRVVFEADPTLLEDFVNAAKELEADGVSAITSTCGFLSPLQQAVAEAVSVPVFLSALMQVPMVYAMTTCRVAIVTANSNSLTPHVLQEAGIGDDIPISVIGLQDVEAFSNPILYDGATLDADQIEVEFLALVDDMLETYPDVGSFVFECHNLAPYAHAVQIHTGKPVFDIIDFAHWIYGSINKRTYPRE